MHLINKRRIKLLCNKNRKVRDQGNSTGIDQAWTEEHVHTELGRKEDGNATNGVLSQKLKTCQGEVRYGRPPFSSHCRNH